MKRAFWGFFIAAMAVYVAMVAWSLPLISSQAGGLAPFDMRPWGYDLADAQAFLDTLSAAGQAHYMGIQHKLDLAYPVLLGVTLVLGVQLVYARPFSTILAVIALGGSAADFLENAMVRGMLNQHGGELDAGLVAMASFFTVTKSVLHTIALCALLWGGARALWRRVM